MMYRSPSEAQEFEQKRAAKNNVKPKVKLGKRAVVFLVLLVIGSVAIIGMVKKYSNHSDIKMLVSEIGEEKTDKKQYLERRRLNRKEIPSHNFMAGGYAKLFCDTNSVQLVAARKNGIKNPNLIGDPSQCEDLTRVTSTKLYFLDTLYHSKPYLVPEANLMLQYIGERFQEIMEEQHPGKHYLPIVTSVLRSHEDIQRLRRRNRNATDTSCHLYGTTVDFSYTRFLSLDGPCENGSYYYCEPYLVNALAQALYELRYEGLIYVKYERRQSCFHLTLRSTEYKGNKKSRIHKYKPLTEVIYTIPDDNQGIETLILAPQESASIPSKKDNTYIEI